MKKENGAHVGEWLSAYYDGELSGSRLEQIQNHLLTCEQCRSELEVFGQVSELLQSAPLPAYRVNADRFTAQVMLQLPHKQELTEKQKAYPKFWKAIPLLIIGLWAFLQAVLWITQVILLVFGNSYHFVSLGRFMVELSNLGTWARFMVPFPEIVIVDIVLTIFLVCILWGWLASWWAVKKIRS